MRWLSSFAAATLVLAFLNGQSLKPGPSIKKPPVTETRIDRDSRTSPRVTFRCAKKTSTSELLLNVRNDGPDGLDAGTTVYYYYRTPGSDMSITSSDHLAARLDKGGIFTIRVGDNAQTRITECGCSLKRLIPTAKTTSKKVE